MPDLSPVHVPAPTDPSAKDATTFPEYAARVGEKGGIRAGVPLPLGVHRRGTGVNFALLSRHATRVWLEFYEHPHSSAPTASYVLTPGRHRTGSVWHIWVDGITSGQLYGYRVDGPFLPEKGLRYNRHKLLLDPYATAITHLEDWDFRKARAYPGDHPKKDLALSTSNNAAFTPKCVVTDEPFDWEDDRRPYRPWSSTVIYELHVRGFTIHPTSGVTAPGTYRGLIDKIPYLLDLGVTAVEILPVQEFNENEMVRQNPLTGEPLRNYWGYNPTAMMAPNGLYSSSGSMGQQTLEFREMVKALHKAGIEVIIDIVLNHTAEGNELGPTICWRGIDNTIYYILAEDPRFYKDYTGTGNTIKADQPIVRDYILDTLRYWAVEMRVDGFRFDLASVLGRDQDGTMLSDPPLIERIAEDPVLGNIKMIAEAWDAAGAYQVGTFFKRRWAEWNGRYRDDVRRFWRGDPGRSAVFAHRLCGSDDLYRDTKGPDSSINYVTSHDGFTLHDLVSYDRRHNEANGEFNRDGPMHPYSANYGVEGPTDDPEILAVRRRQVKNFLLTLFLSRGVPMLLGGDEFQRTQGGNNNAYCQDNETSWFDWSRAEKHRDLTAFVKALTAFRRDHFVLRRMEFYEPDQIRWFDSSGASPAWQDPDAPNQVGAVVHIDREPSLLFLFNAAPEPTRFVLPSSVVADDWWVRFDTSRPHPDDAVALGVRPLSQVNGHVALPRYAAVVAERK